MNIGITYDLRDDYLAQGYSEDEIAEFDSIETIDALDRSLRKLGFEVHRIGSIRNLVLELAEGRRWDLVFNIAEGLKGYGRESQVPALLDAYEVLYTFSDPLVLSLTLHKGMAKHIIRGSGLLTPDFELLSHIEEIEDVDLRYPLFAKPVGEGSGVGISASSLVRDRAELIAVCRDLLLRFEQAVLIEEYLPGREFTVGLLGTGALARVVGVMEVVFSGSGEAPVYSKFNKDNYKDAVQYVLRTDSVALECSRLALSAWQALGGRDAGRLDLRLDAKGRPHFLEANPLAGLHPEHSDLPILCCLAGMSFDQLIEAIIESAFLRSRKRKITLLE